MNNSLEQYCQGVRLARMLARSLHGRFFVDAAGKLRLVNGAPDMQKLVACFTQLRRRPLEASAVWEPSQFGLAEAGLLERAILEDMGAALQRWEAALEELDAHVSSASASAFLRKVVARDRREIDYLWQRYAVCIRYERQLHNG